MPVGGRGPFGLPGGKGPDRATKFVLPRQPFQDGVVAIGTLVLSVTQLVLIEGEQDAVRINHNQALLFNRGAPAAATPGQPWYLSKPQRPDVPEAEDSPRVDHTRLHRYRTGYQTVGQPQFLLYSKASQPGEAEAYEVRSARPDLHLYRQAFQTVGQSYRLWPRASVQLESEEYAQPKPVNLTAFRQPVTSIAGQPSFLWPPAKPDLSLEDDARRSDHTWLHRYRVGFQTVGQPRLLWPAAVADQTVEPDAQRVDQTLLHRYRVGFQTVGQTWQHWIKPQQRVEAEEYTVSGPASLYPFRQITIIAAPGQPWWAWPQAVADQTVEPNPVATDHAAVLYPFRPHPAITPPAPLDALSGGTYGLWDFAEKRRKRRDEEPPAIVEDLARVVAGNEPPQQTEAQIRAAQPKVDDLSMGAVALAKARDQQIEAIKAELKRQEDDDDDDIALLLTLL